ncbi:MAG: protein PhnA [Oleiphilaceae bacterium]|jgi:protein PhnA
MASESDLKDRCGGSCELCASSDSLVVYQVPDSEGRGDADVMICSHCLGNIQSNLEEMNVNHWRCLSESMWSTVPVVQILAWRVLKRISAETWAQDLLDMLYLEELALEWAEAGVANNQLDVELTRDSNGAILKAGDNVTVIKDLNVKGSSMVAKRGTVVRGISLSDNPEHIEGRVNGARIVILTCFVKKS